MVGVRQLQSVSCSPSVAVRQLQYVSCSPSVACSLFIGLLVALVGCAEEKPRERSKAQSVTEPPGETDASEVEEISPTCGALTLTAQPIFSLVMEEPAPLPEGGQLVDGVYDSVAHHVHGELQLGANIPFQQTMAVREAGQVVEIARRRPNGELLNATFEALVEDEFVALSAHCPAELEGKASRLAFTANPDGLVIFSTRSDGTETRTIYQRRTVSGAL